MLLKHKIFIHILKMDVEVDPALFVKCRLCLDEMGMYQIVPAVQEQMQFCFQIEVTPYDGLSQLICRQCKNILTNYFKIKTDYVQKQNILRERTNKKETVTIVEGPQQEMVSSSQQMDCDDEDPNETIVKETRRMSSSSQSHHSDRNTNDVKCQETDINNLNGSKDKIINSLNLKKDYVKKFACRICRKHFCKRFSVMKHSSTHNKLYKEYGSVLKKICTVALNKIDNIENITPLKHTVKYSPSKILQEQCILEYNIVFVNKNTLKDDQSDNDNVNNNTKKEVSKERLCQDNSSSSKSFKRRQYKKFRILSNSSDEFSNDATVAKDIPTLEKISTLKNINSKVTKEVECINIDDTSTESTPSKNNDIIVPSTAGKGKEKVGNTIQHIAMMCYNKYVYRIKNTSQGKEEQEASDMQLQNKILSLGRKVIYKQGFHNNGLLKFLEKKNLEIIWIPQKSLDVNQVRIITKLKNKYNDDCWKKVDSTEFSNYENSEFLRHLFKNDIYLTKKQSTACSDITEESTLLKKDTQEKSLPLVLNVNDNFASNIDSDCNLKSKLLNANPVANPKQLPKKVNATSRLDNTENIPNDSNLLQQLGDTNKSVTCMPVITSTTSLAPFLNKDKDSTSSESANFNTARIKVKPVSELLSKTALNNLHQQGFNTNGIWKPNENLMTEQNETQVSPETQQTINSSFTPLNSGPSILRDEENIILDSIELPNTKTDSPFTYFRDLLNMHGIILMATNATLHNNFFCLIKYKAEFKQETTQEPKGVSLSLSLFCFDRQFCLQIRDKNQSTIDVNKISAHWEWEILKTYTGDVSKKILKNSQKLGQDMFKYTRTFVSLLESIKIVPE